MTQLLKSMIWKKELQNLEKMQLDFARKLWQEAKELNLIFNSIYKKVS